MKRWLAAVSALAVVTVAGCSVRPTATPAPATVTAQVTATEYIQHTAAAPAAVTRPAAPATVTRTVTVTTVRPECRQGFLKALDIMSSDNGPPRRFNTVVTMLVNGNVLGVAAILDGITDDTNTVTYTDLPEFDRLTKACLEG